MDSTIETKPLSTKFVLKMTQTVLAIMFSCFLSNVIIIKTKVILPRRFWISCLGPLAYLLPKLLKLFGCPTFRL